MRLLRLIVFGAASVILGLLSLGLFFLADLAPGQTIFGRLLAALVFFLVSGMVIGYSNPKGWGIAGLMAWGGVLMGVSRLLSGQGSRLEGVMLLTLPPFFSLLAGYLGLVVHQRDPWPRSSHNGKPS